MFRKTIRAFRMKTGIWRKAAVATAAMAALVSTAGLARAGVPTITEDARLLADDAMAGDMLGRSLDADGDTTIIGAPFDDVNGAQDQGSAYIFHRDPKGVWTQQAHLIAPDGAAFLFFGSAVAIGGDIAVVGCPIDQPPSGVPEGAVYVYRRDANSVWTFDTKVTPPPPISSGSFGCSVAIDNDIIAIGACADGESALFAGAAYVYNCDAKGNVSLIQKILASDGAMFDNFGKDVDYAGDSIAGVLVVGAPSHSTNNIVSGSAYFYKNLAGVFDETEVSPQNGNDNDSFGFAVAITDDPTTPGNYKAIVGAPNNDDAGTDAGAASIYSVNSAAVTLSQVLPSPTGGPAGDPTGNSFGTAVDIQGNTAVVGAPGADVNNVQHGGLAAQYELSTPLQEFLLAAFMLSLDENPFANVGSDVVLPRSTSRYMVISAFLNDDACMGDPNCNSGAGLVYPVTSIVPGDINGDGFVGGADLAALLTQWGPCPAPLEACPADLNGDGVVNGADLAILLANWTV